MKAYNKTEEYDAFGPWIHIVGEAHALPPIFAAECPEADRAKLLIKIPRMIERRNANPDMHLYDSVVGVTDDYILILNRNGDDITRETMAIADIQAIQKTNDLLAGQLQLCAADNVLTIDYNTVSDNIISRIVTLIRGMWGQQEPSFSLPTLPYSINTVGFLYTNLINAMQKEDAGTGLIAYQPQMMVRMYGLRHILSLLKYRRVMQSTAFLTDSRELITICQSRFIQSERHNTYAYTYTYVPLSGIAYARIISYPGYESLRQFEYGTADHRFASFIGEENSGIEALSRVLNGLLTHQS